MDNLCSHYFTPFKKNCHQCRNALVHLTPSARIRHFINLYRQLGYKLVKSMKNTWTRKFEAREDMTSDVAWLRPPECTISVTALPLPRRCSNVYNTTYARTEPHSYSSRSRTHCTPTHNSGSTLNRYTHPLIGNRLSAAAGSELTETRTLWLRHNGNLRGVWADKRA